MSTYKISALQPIDQAAYQLREYFPELTQSQAINVLRNTEFSGHYVELAGELHFVVDGWEFTVQ